MAKKRATAKQLTVSTDGVFCEGVRQSQPDPLQVAQVLAAPEPISLWVRDQMIITELEMVIQKPSSAVSSKRSESVRALTEGNMRKRQLQRTASKNLHWR